MSDEGVFRIVLDIFLRCSDQFKSLLPMLRGFHTAKCVKHCIGKFVRGWAIEDTLLKTVIFGEKVLESVLRRSNFDATSRTTFLQDAIEKVRWQAF